MCYQSCLESINCPISKILNGKDPHASYCFLSSRQFKFSPSFILIKSLYFLLYCFLPPWILKSFFNILRHSIGVERCIKGYRCCDKTLLFFLLNGYLDRCASNSGLYLFGGIPLVLCGGNSYLLGRSTTTKKGKENMHKENS